MSCLFCGHEAPANEWLTPAQYEHAAGQMKQLLIARTGHALRRDARSFNRSHRRGFLQMSMTVKGFRGGTDLLPIPPSEPLERHIECEACHAHFAVEGSAFFCPCCGHNSVLRTYDDAMRKVRVKLDTADLIRRQFRAEGRRDDGALVARSLIESGLTDCVVAFQRLAERLYQELPTVTPPPMNAFQRLEQGSNLWRQATGKGYDDWLADHNLASLTLLFQRRHLLAHAEGIVDQMYLDRSGDTAYRLGQRIVVKPAHVNHLLDLVERLVQAMRLLAVHAATGE